MRKFLAVLSVAVVAATGAQAVTVNLTGEFGGDATVSGKTATFNKGGISGSIEAFSTNPESDGYPAITTSSSGLGVVNGPRDVAYFPGSSTSPEGDYLSLGTQIDGRNQDDWLVFSFNTAVRLISVTLGSFNPNDPYGDNAFISVDGGPVERISTKVYEFGDVIAQSFRVEAREKDDEFVVKKFTVAPIPLPASALLLLGGLAGFGLMRRKRIS